MILFLAPSIKAQKDPINNFCRRFGHQTTVIDRRLYIDGGLVNWNPMQSDPANYSNTYLLYQDLDVDSSSGMPQLYSNLSKNSTVPDVSGGILWDDSVNKMFYLFGGEYFQGSPPSSGFLLFAFDILNNYWISLASPQQASISAVSYGAGAAISARGEGYYYGGWLSNNSVAGWTGPAVATTGLVMYDMDANSWTNSSGPDTVPRAEGAMVYLPASDGGMLVYFGGITDPYHNGTVVGQSLDTIFLYDVLSSKWYTQTASGAIPGDRRRFCAGAAWAPDYSSYNIYLYGGASMPPNTTGYDDVYVLSIPSFTWIKLYPTDGNYTGEYPHHSMTCNVISGAQMLIIGGSFPLSEDCDVPQQWGTHNADLTESIGPDDTLWQLFNTNASIGYTVPDPIVSAIGGGPSGGATKTAPADGWDSADLPVLITRTATVAARTPTRVIPTDVSGSGSSLSKGATIGIAVGCAAAGILLLICCWGMVRRYRKRRGLGKKSPQNGPPPPMYGPEGSPYQPYGPSADGASRQYVWSPEHHPHQHHGPYMAGVYTPAPPQIPAELAAPYAEGDKNNNSMNTMFAGDGGGAGLGSSSVHGASPVGTYSGTVTGTSASSPPGGGDMTPFGATKADEVQMPTPQQAPIAELPTPGSGVGVDGSSPAYGPVSAVGSQSPVPPQQHNEIYSQQSQTSFQARLQHQNGSVGDASLSVGGGGVGEAAHSTYYHP